MSRLLIQCTGFWQTELGKNLPGKKNDGRAQWQKHMMCAQELAEGTRGWRGGPSWMVGALNTKASNWMCSAVSWELWKFCVFIYVAIQGLNCSEVRVCCSMQDLLVVACKLLAVARGI